MKTILVLVAGAILSLQAIAADKAAPQRPMGGKAPEWTKEQRETMAKNHEAMAACLRSEKSVMECRQDMMKNCKEAENCPMKGRMDMNHGMMGERGN